MQKVLDVLCEIEDKAKGILNSTSEQKAVLNQQLHKEMEALDKAYAKQTEAQLNELRQKMEKEIFDEHTALVKSYESRLQNLETDFKKNRETYVQTIFESIINEQG